MTPEDEGVMEAAESSTLSSARSVPTIGVAIVGGSARAADIARQLSTVEGVRVLSVCALPSEPAGMLATESDVPVLADPLSVFSTGATPDLVIDLSGDVVIRTALESVVPVNTELLSGGSADLIWNVLKERKPVVQVPAPNGAATPAGGASARPEADSAGRERRLQASNEALARANRDLETRLAEVYFMHEFVKALVAYHRVEDVASVVVDACAGILGADVAAIYLLDRERWLLCLSQSQGRPIETVAGEVELSDPLLGRAFNEGVVVGPCGGPGMPGAPSSTWLDATARLRAEGAVALRVGGEAVGVLAFGWSSARSLDDAEIDRLRVMADQSALSLQNALLHAELERLSVTDRLTELFNHGYLTQRLDQEIERADRFGHALSVIMLDIDDFKALNDRYGHLAGDDVLRSVSALVRMNLREIDVAARYGGEEFVVIVPETDAHGARAVAERIRQSVSDHVFLEDMTQGGVHVTVSIGVATFSADGDSVGSLVEAADSAMYRAKRAGKDRVEVASADAR